MFDTSIPSVVGEDWSQQKRHLSPLLWIERPNNRIDLRTFCESGIIRESPVVDGSRDNGDSTVRAVFWTEREIQNQMKEKIGILNRKRTWKTKGHLIQISFKNGTPSYSET